MAEPVKSSGIPPRCDLNGITVKITDATASHPDRRPTRLWVYIEIRDINGALFYGGYAPTDDAPTVIARELEAFRQMNSDAMALPSE
jgi:hypothetical protein